MYYIHQGLHWKWAGIFVACMLFIQNAGGTLIQANTISNVVHEAFLSPALVTGLILAVIMSFIISGGFRRLVYVAQKIVPVMAGVYVLGGLLILLMNAGKIPVMLASILEGAFSLEAGKGALMGITMREAMRFGIARDEAPVGLLQEKAETISLKNELQSLLHTGSVTDAWQYLCSALDKRPDLSLQLSDFNQELILIEHILNVCRIEEEEELPTLLQFSKDLDTLIRHFRLLLSIVEHIGNNIATEEEIRYLLDCRVSYKAIVYTMRWS